MEQNNPGILVIAIGSRVSKVTNPYTSILRIQYDTGDAKLDETPEEERVIRIGMCDWELEQEERIACHSESEDIGAGVQGLLGKKVLGVSWHCRMEESDGSTPPTLWGAIKFSENWRLCFSAYSRSSDKEADDDWAAYTALLSIQFGGREMVFLESGEVKCIECDRNAHLGARLTDR